MCVYVEGGGGVILRLAGFWRFLGLCGELAKPKIGGQRRFLDHQNVMTLPRIECDAPNHVDRMQPNY